MSRGRPKDADVLEECGSSSAVTPSTMQSHSSCSGPSGAEAASSSPFYSARIEGLSELRSKFTNELEFDVESSKSHWTETEVSAASADSDDSDVQVPNSAVFEEMKQHPEWGLFFRRQPYELEIGAKIAEGGQAEIFEALGWNKYDPLCADNKKIELVLKVFKKGFRLLDLQRMWHPGIASAASHTVTLDGVIILGPLLLRPLLLGLAFVKRWVYTCWTMGDLHSYLTGIGVTYASSLTTRCLEELMYTLHLQGAPLMTLSSALQKACALFTSWAFSTMT